MTDENITVEPLVLTREYTASIELVFDCWTKSEHLCNWQFPMPGFRCEFLQDDIQVGGSALHKMIMPSGTEMYLLTEYDEISPPDKIVFRQYDSNAEGEKLPNAHMSNWPKDLVATVLLENAGTGTLMTFTWEPLNPTPEEAAAFSAAVDKVGGGWGGGFEQLATYLDTVL
jgi:uncharacterized protein YndB with AHSA1/START domain